MKAQICNSLSQLDGQALSIFENELRAGKNELLLADCKEDLLNKLDSYFAEQNKVAPTNNFTFNSNIQKRDVSKGYTAYTGDVGHKEVVLTFDDGPNGVYTPKILAALKKVQAKAIFFATGKSARNNPALLREVAADGHSIGSHSTTHACLGANNRCKNQNGRMLTHAEAVAEIKSGHQAVYDVLGWVSPFFRFPYGESDPSLRDFLKANSTADFRWNIDSEDWRAGSNAQLVEKVMSQVRSKGKGIILLHDIQRRTAESLPTLLSELYHGGYSIVLLQSANPADRYNSPLVKKRLP
jgi:peptidoglycan/xylan/chitin deacetylase (PgdA/CDA1 family)